MAASVRTCGSREFNRLEFRDDLFSPASNHVTEMLIPALAVRGVFKNTFVGSLDIAGAYLQLPQSNRRRVQILDNPMGSDLLIYCFLPGQRDGSRRWFDFFISLLTEKLNVEQCAEQPAMLQIPASGGGVLPVQLDDCKYSSQISCMLERR